MAEKEFGQPPDNEIDLVNWRKNIHEGVFGQDEETGKLDGNNITNITDPGDTTDVTDVAVKFNALLAELRILGIM